MTDLSPAAQAVWDAAWQLSPVNCKSHEDRRRQQIAAALRAAAQQLPDVRWDGCIQPDAEMSIGINWSRDALHAIAAELEGPPMFKPDEVHPFVVRHYTDDQRPSIKGNGFDGLEVGEDRQEAEEFIAWINARLFPSRNI